MNAADQFVVAAVSNGYYSSGFDLAGTIYISDGNNKVVNAITIGGLNVGTSAVGAAATGTMNFFFNAAETPAEQMRAVSDRVNPAKFYSFNTETGQLLESMDGAKTFSLRTAPVAPRGNYAMIAPVPGREGDLWIGAGKRVFHSADSGVTFVALEGMSDAYKIGFGMAAAGRSSAAVYINGTVQTMEGTFRSEDEGRSWVRVDDAEHQFGWKNAVAGDPRVWGRVYLATGGRGVVYGEPAR